MHIDCVINGITVIIINVSCAAIKSIKYVPDAFLRKPVLLPFNLLFRACLSLFPLTFYVSLLVLVPTEFFILSSFQHRNSYTYSPK